MAAVRVGKGTRAGAKALLVVVVVFLVMVGEKVGQVLVLVLVLVHILVVGEKVEEGKAVGADFPIIITHPHGTLRTVLQ